MVSEEEAPTRVPMPGGVDEFRAGRRPGRGEGWGPVSACAVAAGMGDCGDC
jgi:hypothetical protein